MIRATLPNSWHHVSVEDLATDAPNSLCIGPFGSDLKTSDFVSDGVPVVFVRNIRPNHFCPDVQRYVTPTKAELLRAHRVTSGDVVVTKMGTPPCIAALYPSTFPDGIVTADIIKLTPRCEIVDPKYFTYYLNSHFAQTQVRTFTFGVTRPKVTLNAFRRLCVPLPPLSEQTRIADILDKADTLRRKRQEVSHLVKELPLATFRAMFEAYFSVDATQYALRDVAEVVSGVAKGRKLNGAATREAPYLRVANVQAGYLDLSEIKTIPATESEIGVLALHAGDVVMTEGGDHDKLGRGALWEHGIPDCIHQNHVFRVRVNRKRLLPTFFVHFLQTAVARSYFLRCAKKTTNLASINMTQLRALPLPLPPLALQERFDQELRTMTSAIGRQSEAERKADELFSCLVQRAFRGEL